MKIVFAVNRNNKIKTLFSEFRNKRRETSVIPSFVLGLIQSLELVESERPGMVYLLADWGMGESQLHRSNKHGFSQQFCQSSSELLQQLSVDRCNDQQDDDEVSLFPLNNQVRFVYLSRLMIYLECKL